MLFKAPPPHVLLCGCLWRTRKIIAFHLYNYTLSGNKSMFANDVISRSEPSGSPALTKASSCRRQSSSAGCGANVELSEAVSIPFCLPSCLSSCHTAHHQTSSLDGSNMAFLMRASQSTPPTASPGTFLNAETSLVQK